MLIPVPTAVAIPDPDPIVATVVFDDDHVPPVVDEESVDVFPMHNNNEPVIEAGRFKIVIVCIL